MSSPAHPQTMRHVPTGWRARLSDPAFLLIALIAMAVAVGAGGINAPIGNLAVQLPALGILALHGAALGGFFRLAPRWLVALAAASCLLPLVQLVPLPPLFWRPLPGRELVAQSLDLAGGVGWYPLSVDPARTFVAFLGTLAPLTVLSLGCGLAPRELVRLQRAVIAIGIASALFGTLHLLDPGWGDLYADQLPMPGVLVATFADRNAAALFLDSCLLLLAGLPALPRTAPGWAVWSLAGLFLAVCVLLTQSRTGIVLLLLPAALIAWRAASARLSRAGAPVNRRATLAGLAIALGIAAVAFTVASSGRVEASLSRFAQGDEMRAEMREDALFAAQHYWPVGAGMGTFDEVFQIHESLEYVSPRKAGRAHMDYLELAIEAGLAGLTLAAMWLLWAAWAGWRALRRTGAWPARAGALILAGIAAQSLLSFPLRNQAMLCAAAMGVVLLVRSPISEPQR